MYEKNKLTHKSHLLAVHREIFILSGLNHPNVMKLFEVIDLPTKVILVLELCHGKSLANFIKRKPSKYLPEEEAKPIFKQIVKAVEYLHDIGVVHRDLKLENILINDQGGLNTVKLIDFGFATNCKQGIKLSTFCGTPCYMDPDLSKERKYLGQAVDVWALGVILFKLLTG